jgi:hypothetical protein
MGTENRGPGRPSRGPVRLGKDNAENASQIDRFRETARELGCDEDEAAFKDKLRVIARQKPKEESGQAARPTPRQRKGGASA